MNIHTEIKWNKNVISIDNEEVSSVIVVSLNVCIMVELFGNVNLGLYVPIAGEFILDNIVYTYDEHVEA